MTTVITHWAVGLLILNKQLIEIPFQMLLQKSAVWQRVWWGWPIDVNKKLPMAGSKFHVEALMHKTYSVACTSDNSG